MKRLIEALWMGGCIMVLAAVGHGCANQTEPSRKEARTAAIETATVFESGADGVNSYRIPALAATPKGTLLAFAEARKISWRDKSPTKMVLKRSVDGGKTWGTMQVIRDVDQGAVMDPCVVVDRKSGTVHLLYIVYPPNWSANPVAGLEAPSCTVWTTSSSDEGLSWTVPRDITKEIKNPAWTWVSTGPGIGIQLTQGRNSGRLVAPIHHGNSGSAGGNRVIYSDDFGKSWKCAEGFVAGRNDESQIAELEADTLLVIGRGGSNSWRSISRDCGATWSAPVSDPVLVEPRGGDGKGCQSSLLRYSPPEETEPYQLLFSNPNHSSSRANLTIRLSRDGGATWPVAKSLHPQAAGYSCLTALPDGSIGILYEAADTPEFSREKSLRPPRWMNLVFTRFSPEWLQR